MYSVTHLLLRVVLALALGVSSLLAQAADSFGAEYILGPGDVIRITVYANDDLLTEARMSSEGVVIMPLLGQVKLTGMTVGQASEHISSLLADGYIINPQVNIFIQEFRSKKAIILGRINRPGMIEMSGTVTLLELISQAGGLADDFGEKVTIKRVENGKDHVIQVDLKSLIEGGDMKQNIDIRDGDTIYVGKAGMCYVTGEVQSPNAYKCSDNMTVLKLITLAGGFTGKASKSKVRIVRIVNGQETLLENVALDLPVLPDDVIVVPESFF
ncbi:MAG: SLBB domain-containing protein [Desulfobulbaceae bacterium]